MKRLPSDLRRKQSGAVLIVALIILLMLTLLGISSMNTSSLEERMSGNSQQQARMRQSAESGYAQAFTDTNSYLGDTCQGGADEAPITIVGFMGSTNDLTYCGKAVGYSQIPPSNPELWGTDYRALHFNMRSTVTAGGSLSTTVNGGVYAVVPDL